MNNLFSILLSNRKQWRLFGLSVSLGFICMAFLGISKAEAQKDSMTMWSDTGIYCSSTTTCCQHYKMDITRTGTKWYQLVLTGTSSSDTGCLDLNCARTALYVNGIPYVGTEHISITTSGRSGPITFDVWTDSTNGWTAGTNVEFVLCSKPYAQQSPPIGVDCSQTWSASDWWSYDDAHPNNSNPKDHNYGDSTGHHGWCGIITPCNPACDEVDATSYSSGGSQYVRFCVTRHNWPNQADSIVVTFKPPLAACDSIRFTGDSTYRVHCNQYFLMDSVYYIGPIRFDTMVSRLIIPCPHADTILQAWNSKRTDDSVTRFVFTPRSSYYKLAPCGTWCFTIKKCPSIWRNVKINTYPLGDTSGNCSSDTTGAALKKGNGEFIIRDIVSDEQNYPNPLTWDHDFTTTIPFSIPYGGIASIKISNTAGKVIKEESMSFIGGGRHFFYFTGSDIPAGKYFYQIEYPKGNIIVNKSMIIVK